MTAPATCRPIPTAQIDLVLSDGRPRRFRRLSDGEVQWYDGVLNHWHRLDYVAPHELGPDGLRAVADLLEAAA